MVPLPDGNPGRIVDTVNNLKRVRTMIILGAILLAAGFFFDIGLLWTAGVVLIVIGLVLMIAGRMGHAIGGRRHYY